MKADLAHPILSAAVAALVSLATAVAADAASSASAGSRAAGHRDMESEIRRELRERLPRVADDIRAEQRDGNVVLSGSVDVLAKKEMATEAAESVRGVQSVTNNLQVDAEPRTDAEIARDVTADLRSDPATLALDVDVAAEGGVVTLRGTVDTVPQKRIAAWVASGLRGVREVRNEIRIHPEPRSDREVHSELSRHYSASALFNDDDIAIKVEEGIVVLSGRVDSALEKNWARDDAWVRGVQRVDADELRVEYDSAHPSARTTELSDEDIRQTVMKALVYDPRVGSTGPEVEVASRVVTLSGVVSNLRAKRAALQIARNTGGVADVIDRLRVQPDKDRTDAEVAQAVRAAVASSAALAGNTVEVRVSQGRVTLSGTVDSAYEKWVVAELAERTGGAVALENKLTLEGGNAGEAREYYYSRGTAMTPAPKEN